MLSLHCCLGFSLVAVSRGYASLWCSHFSLQWPLLLGSTGSRHMGFSNCTAWAQELQFTGLVAQRQVWSSQTRDQTHVSRIGRHILYHWATGEAPTCIFLSSELSWKTVSPFNRSRGWLGKGHTALKTPWIHKRILASNLLPFYILYLLIITETEHQPSFS